MRGLRLSEAEEIGRGHNNFDTLRLVAALFVVFAHAFEQTADRAPWPHGTGIEWGNVGVLIFFSMSGFLVARSWTYDPRPLSYAVKRGLRLMPALVVVLVLTAFLLGPLVTSVEPTSAYLENPATKGYVVFNASFWTDNTLPGVFEDVHAQNAVNGSLWTLALEVKCYVFLALLGVLGLFRRRFAPFAMAAIAVLFASLLVDPIRNALPLGNRAATIMHTVASPHAIVQGAHDGELFPWIQLFAAFMIGAALYALRRWVVLRWELVLVALAIWGGAVALGSHESRVAATWLMPYLVLVLAYRTPWRLLPRRFGDYSYGTYLVHWPVIQTIVVVADPASGWVSFLIALPFTLGLAVLSWHVVEGPALTLKERLAGPLHRAAEAARHPAPREELQPAGGGS